MIFLLLILIVIISQYKLFKKANQSGWAAFIPIYNMIVWLRIINKPWWWLLLMFIPYAGLIWSIWATNLLVKKFGKDEGFTIGIIFLPFIFYPILAFGSSKFSGNSDYQKEDFKEGFDASAISNKQNKIDYSSLSENQKIIKNILEKYASKNDLVQNNNTVNFENEEIIIENKFTTNAGTFALNKVIPIKEITRIYFTEKDAADWFTIETNPNKIYDPYENERSSEFVFALSKDLMKNKVEYKKFMDSFEEMISLNSYKNTSSEQLLNESQNNTGSSNIDFFSPTNASSRENDLKLELENELNKFENKVLSEKFNVNLSDDEIDYWYKIICDRVRMCASNSREISDEDILLENIFGHCDEYGKKHINEDFEFKRNHTTMRILSYGFIFRCLQKISEKISNDNSGISSEFEKEIRLKLIHSKASLYGTIKFALISNIKKDEIKKMFPEFEDDPKLIEGKNSLEEMLMKGFEMDDDNPNKKRLEGIYDGQKRVPIYELSEKQRSNIPLWFKGPFYKRGSEVTSKATGNSFKLNALEKSIFVEIQYNTAMITILSEEGVVSRAHFNNPFLEYMVEVIDKGTEWFESNNIKAFEALFDTK